jgi:hypothetical protein
MRVPVAPVHAPIVDANGMITPEWSQYHDNLHIQLNYHLPEDGSIIPSVDNAQITEMEKEFLDPDNTIPNPKFKQTKHVYNTETKKYMLNVDGVFKDITVT